MNIVQLLERALLLEGYKEAQTEFSDASGDSELVKQVIQTFKNRQQRISDVQ